MKKHISLSLIGVITIITSSSLIGFTLINVDPKNQIEHSMNRAYRLRNPPNPILIPGEHRLVEPDWTRNAGEQELEGSGDFSTTKFDFWLSTGTKEKKGLNTLMVEQFRNLKGQKIMANQETTAFVFYSPTKDKIEYLLAWQEDGNGKTLKSDPSLEINDMLKRLREASGIPEAPPAPMPSAGDQKRHQAAATESQVSRTAGSLEEVPAAPGGPRSTSAGATSTVILPATTSSSTLGGSCH